VLCDTLILFVLILLSRMDLTGHLCYWFFSFELSIRCALQGILDDLNSIISSKWKQNYGIYLTFYKRSHCCSSHGLRQRRRPAAENRKGSVREFNNFTWISQRFRDERCLNGDASNKFGNFKFRYLPRKVNSRQGIKNQIEIDRGKKIIV